MAFAVYFVPDDGTKESFTDNLIQLDNFAYVK